VQDAAAELLNGKLEMLLRTAGGSQPVYMSIVLFWPGANGRQGPVVLVTQRGLAGCREHRRLVRRLPEVT
jgi:hypothetical protein